MARLRLYAAHSYAVLGAVGGGGADGGGDGGGEDPEEGGAGAGGGLVIVHNPHNKYKGGPGQRSRRGALHRQSSLVGDDLDGDGKAADDFLLTLDDLQARGVFTTCHLMFPTGGGGGGGR